MIPSLSSTRPFPNRATLLLVWGTWALMTIAALGFVAHYGSNVPSWDDWDMVPTMTGAQPVTAGWLWSQHNEHRVPLPRLLLLGLYRIKTDFRVPMLFNVLVMGALALAMILAAGRTRGKLSYTDVFFPLLLLNWAHGLNFIWAWQLEFFVSTALAGAVLLIAARDSAFRISTAAAIGICLLLLGVSGAHGVALLPALAVWLGGATLLRWRSGEPYAQRDGVLALGLAFGALLLTALYFVGYQSVPYHPTSSSVRATLRTALQFLTMGFGPVVSALWPASGIAMLGLLLLTCALLGRVFYKQHGERFRALGLLGFFAAMGSLAVGLGIGRNGFESRYITLSVPALCGVYLVWSLYGPPRFNHPARAGLFLIALLTLWPNTKSGVAYAADLRSRLGSFERDLAAGVPGPELIGRYHAYLHPHQDLLTDYLPMLRRAGIGQFRVLRDAPPSRHIVLPLVPTAMNQVTWQEGNTAANGSFPYLDFALAADTYVHGVRLRYTPLNTDGRLPFVSIYWKRSGHEAFDRMRYYKFSPTGDRANWERGAWTRLNDADTTVTVWIYDHIHQLRISPDRKPGVFNILELALIVPVKD